VRSSRETTPSSLHPPNTTSMMMEDPTWAIAGQQAARHEEFQKQNRTVLAEQLRLQEEAERAALAQQNPLIPSFLYRPIQHPERIFENCVFKSAFGGVAGVGFGFMLGVFFASTAYDVHVDTQGTTYQKVVEGFKATWRQGLSTARNFGMVSVVFAGVECVIEKQRAKTDIINGVSAGCLTGAAFSARAGPTAALAGCAGFAAFSAAIEWMLLGH